MNKRNERLISPLVLVWLLILSGCNDFPPDVTSDAGDGVQAIDATTTENESPRVLLSAATELTKDDPTADGWETEAFSNDAGSQLNRLGEFLMSTDAAKTGNEAVKSVAAGLITRRFSSEPLLPKLEMVFSDGAIEVHRSSDDGEMAPINGDSWQERFSDAIKPLRQSLEGYPGDRHFKFKLFRVEVSPTDSTKTTTRQYVQFAGRSKYGSREINATWVVNWHSGEAAALPTIESIRVESTEQVTSTSPRMFVDETESVLGANVSYGVALVPGIADWQSRMEAYLGVSRYGHHGLAIGDANGDGLDDLFVCQTGGLPNHLFLQQSDGTVLDASASAGVDYLDNTRSALFLDLDNDDDQDLVVATASGLLFFENDGEAHFGLRARIPNARQAFSLAAADYNLDGLLDIYVCVYFGGGDSVSDLPVPVPYFDATNGGRNFLIRNQGDWRFDDVTDQVGLDAGNCRYSFAAVWEDFDQDGDSDIFVVNDYGPNDVYRNTDGQFENVATEVGIVEGAFGMSATFADYDRDGAADLYVSNMFSAAGNRVTFQPRFRPTDDDAVKTQFRHLARGNSLFRGSADGRFTDVSAEQGVTMGRWSWGALFADINNDGWSDLLVANGFITGKSKDDL